MPSQALGCLARMLEELIAQIDVQRVTKVRVAIAGFARLGPDAGLRQRLAALSTARACMLTQCRGSASASSASGPSWPATCVRSSRS